MQTMKTTMPLQKKITTLLPTMTMVTTATAAPTIRAAFPNRNLTLNIH